MNKPILELMSACRAQAKELDCDEGFFTLQVFAACIAMLCQIRGIDTKVAVGFIARELASGNVEAVKLGDGDKPS